MGDWGLADPGPMLVGGHRLIRIFMKRLIPLLKHFASVLVASTLLLGMSGCAGMESWRASQGSGGG
jgi:hypothetical protein